MATIESLIDNVERVLFGKREAIELTLIGLLGDGHVLLEDVPGTGKTTLGRAIARSIRGSFQRIQFTSDLLPSDVTGVSVFDPEAREFRFRPGPLFGNVVLADELNRTTPRTQSALLEAMNERQVTVDGVTHELPRPFLVVATQNPLEFEGTYPLPESQLDRFLVRVPLGYPGREAERRILRSRAEGDPVETLEPVATPEEVAELVVRTRSVYVDEAIADYVLDVVEATRTSPDLELGASPRAALGLFRAAQARAVLSGRDFATPDDVRGLIGPVLGHRVLPRDAGIASFEAADQALARIAASVSVPQP